MDSEGLLCQGEACLHLTWFSLGVSLGRQSLRRQWCSGEHKLLEVGPKPPHPPAECGDCELSPAGRQFSVVTGHSSRTAAREGDAQQLSEHMLSPNGQGDGGC